MDEKVKSDAVWVPENAVPLGDLVEVPYIPMPVGRTETTIIDDTFDAAVKFAIIGAGQGGSRLAQTFYEQGYRRVCVINTAIQDLTPIDLPEKAKLAIAVKGAGKDPQVASQVLEEHYEDVLDHMRRNFGTDFDRVLICVGAGGGTGSGCAEGLVDIAHDLLVSLGVEKGDECQVGVLVALPKNSEGKKPCANTTILLNKLFKLSGVDAPTRAISPLIIIDNERIKQIHPGLSVKAFWDTANKSIVSLFHLFNSIAVKESSYASFDTADYLTILDSGVIAFGAAPIPKWSDPTDVSYAVRDNLTKNILAGGMDLRKGTIAGCVFIAGDNILNTIPEENLDHGFEMLSRIVSGEGVVHRGIYRGNQDTLTAYTVIGGLGIPEERMEETARIGELEDWDGT